MLAISCFSPLFASDLPAEFSHIISLAPAIPVYSSPYGVIPGIGYEFRIVKDDFLFSLNTRVRGSAGAALSDGSVIYGIYKNEWSVPAAEAEGSAASYICGEAGVSFGWNIAVFFEKRQFITLDFSVLFEREDLGGRVFIEACRYGTALSLSTEVFGLFGNTCLASVGYGSVSYARLLKPGVLGGFIRAGISMEWRMIEPAEEIYKRAPDMEIGGEEGEILW